MINSHVQQMALEHGRSVVPEPAKQLELMTQKRAESSQVVPCHNYNKVYLAWWFISFPSQKSPLPFHEVK